MSGQLCFAWLNSDQSFGVGGMKARKTDVHLRHVLCTQLHAGVWPQSREMLSGGLLLPPLWSSGAGRWDGWHGRHPAPAQQLSAKAAELSQALPSADQCFAAGFVLGGYSCFSCRFFLCCEGVSSAPAWSAGTKGGGMFQQPGTFRCGFVVEASQ